MTKIWEPKRIQGGKCCANCGKEFRISQHTSSCRDGDEYTHSYLSSCHKHILRYDFCPECIEKEGENTLARKTAIYWSKQISLTSLSKSILREKMGHQENLKKQELILREAIQLSRKIETAPVDELSDLLNKLSDIDHKHQNFYGASWDDVQKELKRRKSMVTSETVSGITYDSLDYGAIAWCPDCQSYVYGKRYGSDTCFHNNLEIVVTADENKDKDYTLLGSLISGCANFALHVSTHLLKIIQENPDSILCYYDKGETEQNGNKGTWLFLDPNVYLDENDSPQKAFDVYGRIVF